MGMIGSGMISPLGGAKTIRLSGTSGSEYFTVLDGDGFPIFRVDSTGNLLTKGGVKRL